MPVFHTKTIESILEPVAQQVSKLVILHEEADDGNQMPDLSYPVLVVKKAADNLIAVGYETVETSDDLVLKQEMPPALKRVQEACVYLEEASHILKKEPTSTSGKRELIAGERGILQGVSTILLTFDESEVRKILQVCRQVLEYLSITELIEKMDDLVTFVKNLTPILTKMTREINAREQELTHQIHVDLLAQHLDQVKELTPLFISSIKICLIIAINNDYENPVLLSATQNKEYLIKRLSTQIEEIIRILQLTTHDEDSWMCDDFTIMKQKFNNFEVKLRTCNFWLNDKMAVCEGIGEKSLRNALEDADLILNKLGSEQNFSIINDTIRNIKLHLDDLCSIITNGNKNSPIGLKKVQIISDQLVQLHSHLKNMILNSQTDNNLSKLAPNFAGKVEQAIKWFNNPYFEHKIGEQATRLIIEESQLMAIQQKNSAFKQKYLQTNYDCDYLVNKLVELVNSNQTDQNRSSCFNLGRQLFEKMTQIGYLLNKCLLQQVADDFLDIYHPIKKLTETIMSENSLMNKKDKFEQTAHDFMQHTHRLCNTAQKLANSNSQTRNKRTAELINELTTRSNELAPQIVNAAFIVMSMPGNRSLTEHYDLMQQQWQSNMITLQRLVDESVDSVSFIEACEQSIIRETFLTQTAIQENNKQAIVLNALNIARRTNRIIQVAAQEAENSEENSFVANIITANEELKKSLPPMVQASKMIAQQPNNKENFLNWTQSNEKLIHSISKVKESLTNNDLTENSIYSSLKFSEDAMSSQEEDTPDISLLKLNDELNEHCYSQLEVSNIESRQCNKVSRPTPLPDLLEEETEKEFPLPKLNQPILMAAHDLHVSVNQWYSCDNDMIAAAKRITMLMAKLSSLVRREVDINRKDLIATAKQLADESFEFTRIAKLLAQDCTDKRMRINLLQNCERIPTIGTQLKILSTVKATMLKGETENGQNSKRISNPQGSEVHFVSKEDQEATEMLIFCAQNLNSSVKATCASAKSASIKLKPDSLLKFRWVKKRNINQIKN